MHGMRTSGRHARLWLAALAACLLIGLAALVPAAGAKPPNYVSLGDSYTAGPVIPLQIPPFGCLKSDHNYPHLAAPDLPVASLRDPSCSGATTDDMFSPQDVDPDGPNPPQLDSLDANTRIASLGIGGNDIGFSEIADNCTSDSPEGHPCQDHYVVNGDDTIHDRIVATGPKVAAVIQAIHSRAPSASVYVVNYLPIFPETGTGCWPQVPVARDDVPYLRAKQQELNAMLASEASANGAKLVDAYTAGIGHDACQLPLTRWVEPAVPNQPAAPLHPNLAGMQGTARALVKAVHGH
jgi:lysophospholipase L1-like esterase